MNTNCIRIGILCLGLFTGFASMTANATSALSQRVMNVGIKPLPGRCSYLELSFGAAKDETIEVPKGITGLYGEEFTHKVLWITRGDEKWPMTLDHQNAGSAEDSSDDVTVLPQTYELYLVEIDFHDYFDLEQGSYYIYYEYIWDRRVDEPYEVTKEAISERYFFQLDNEGCLHFALPM